MPIQELGQQIGDLLDVLVGPLLTYEQIDDAVRGPAFPNMPLAPSTLLLGIAQNHCRCLRLPCNHVIAAPGGFAEAVA